MKSCEKQCLKILCQDKIIKEKRCSGTTVRTAMKATSSMRRLQVRHK